MTRVAAHSHGQTETRNWARIISDVVSPPVVWTILAFPLAFAEATAGRYNAIATATLYGFLVCWVPVMFIAWMVKRGHITDIHMKLRHQRILPFGVSITCSASALGLLWLFKAGTLLILFSVATLLALIIMALVTIFWQISIHAMSITSAVVVSGMVFGLSVALWLSPLIAIVGAARLNLKRHTVTQLIGGAMVGALVPYMVSVIWG